MNEEQTFEKIPVALLLERVSAFQQQGYRLVQICAAKMPESLELTYSFDLADRLANLRLELPLHALKVPSVSSIYWAAFIYENEMHDLYRLTVEGMAVDFCGQFYRTAVPYAFGSTKAPANVAVPVKAPSSPASPAPRAN